MAVSVERVLDDLRDALRARYSVIHIASSEESRVISCLYSWRGSLSTRPRTIKVWSITQGLVTYDAEDVRKRRRVVNEETQDVVVALEEVLRAEPKAGEIYVFKDFHRFLGNAKVVRLIRDAASMLRGTHNTLILLAPTMDLPEDLEKEVFVVDFPLPTEDVLGKLVDQVVGQLRNAPDGRYKVDGYNAVLREKIVRAAQGLTLNEAEDALAKGVVRCGGINDDVVDVINNEKRQFVRKTSALEFLGVPENLNDIGGLGAIKEWLRRRQWAFSDEALEFGLEYPRGVLVAGVPGTGKSAIAKAVASEWKLPLLRLDFGSLFGSLLGETESRLRHALKIVEAVAPVVLVVDEIEKAIGGANSSTNTDGGVTSRVLGYFLTWLQERTAPVFVFFTANNVDLLPPEFLRSGRLDGRFFVDLPSREERKEILAIHIRKRGRNPDDFDLDLLAERSEGYVGAELEQAVKDGLLEAFAQRVREPGRDLRTEDILAALQNIVPLRNTMSREIEALRERAKNGTFMLASRPEGGTGESVRVD